MNIKKVINIIRGIYNANNIILNNVGRPSRKNRVNLHYWDSNIEIGDDVCYNLGDNLSEIIVQYMLERRGLSLETKIKGKKHLYAVGSILSMGYQNATIWGSGFLEELPHIKKILHYHFFRRLDIRAVRGPISRDRLISLGYKCPKIYGDPGILLPFIYKPIAKKTEEYIFIPHFSKEQEYRKLYGDNHVVSMITNDYKKVVDRICSAKKVISGSLHGLILSEAYGTPAIFLRDRPSYKDFKYDDYYASTGREKYVSAKGLEEAIEMKPMNLPENLKELQEGLIHSFPYDLWTNKK